MITKTRFNKRLHYFLAIIIPFAVIGFTVIKDPIYPPSVNTKNGGLFLPGNFEAVVVVDSLQGRARHIAVNSNGDVYVKLRFPDSIGGNVALRDTNRDGRADIIEKFDDYDDKGSYGTAMRIYKGYLYFSSELNVFRQKLSPGQLVPEGPIELIVKDDNPRGRAEHDSKPITFDNTGHIYVPYGAPSNACQERNRFPGSPGLQNCPLLEDYGGIWQFDAEKQNQTRKDGVKFATGLRSIVAMDWNNADKTLYCVMHGRDDLRLLWPDLFTPWQSALLPAEEFLRIKQGTDAGWPYYFYDQMKKKKVLNPEYGGDGVKTADGDKYAQPLIGFPAHWAPNDLFFYTGKQFPARYKNGAFIAFHGSTNRGPYPQSGYFIGFVPYKRGAFTGPVEIFADGFAEVEPLLNVSDAVYRPMGIAMGPDGSLYISETEHGKIWRIRYKGDKTKFGAAQLAAIDKRKLLPHIKTPDSLKDNLVSGMVEGGAKVYGTYCISCHQPNGKGDGNRFPPLDSSEWVIGGRGGRGWGSEKLITTVLKGLEGPITVKGMPYNNAMPSHSFLTDEQVSQVLTYVRDNFGNKAPAVSLAEVADVRKRIGATITEPTKTQ